MATEKRIKILSEAEIDELYSAPVFNESDQRFFFTLNDAESDACRRIRSRQHTCVFVLLLGYFKSKPVPIVPKYGQIKSDLKFVTSTILQGQGLRPFNLSQRDKDRLFTRIFSLLKHVQWKEQDHLPVLADALLEQAASWAAPRALFDAAIEYLAYQRIAIPAYSTLQNIISQVLNQHQQALHDQVKVASSVGLTVMLDDLVSGAVLRCSSCGKVPATSSVPNSRKSWLRTTLYSPGWPM